MRVVSTSRTKKADALSRKIFRTWQKMEGRDAASTLGRSQVFTPFENRLAHAMRSGSNSAFHSEPKDRVWRPEHLFTLVSMPLILNTTADATDLSRVPSCSTRV